MKQIKIRVRFKWVAAIFCTALFLASGLSFAAEEKWAAYENGRFGYSAEYPDLFQNVRHPDNGDGVWMESNDEDYRLTLSGGYNVLESDGAALLSGALERVSHIVSESDKSGPGWYRVIYSDDGGRDGNEHLFHEYGVVNKETWASFVLVYPKTEEKRFVPILARMENGLKLPGASVKQASGKNTKNTKDAKVKRSEKVSIEMQIMEKSRSVEGVTNIRDKPDAKTGKVIAAIPRHPKDPEMRGVLVTGQQGNWFSVKLKDGKKGWAHSSVLGCFAAVSAEGEAYLFSKPDEKAITSTRIPKDTPLFLTAVEGTWIKITYTDKKGKRVEGWLSEKNRWLDYEW